MMKKPTLTGIMALLFILAVSAACMQTPNIPVPAKNTTEIHYTTYGGFIMPAYAVQQLIVTPDRATFTIMSREGTITERYEKNLTKEQYTAIVNVFAENNFSSHADRYEEGQNHISDVGWTDISLIEGTRNKTVTTYNVNNYLPDGLILIRKKLQEAAAYTRTPGGSELRQIAETWITGAPTYAYDGSNLTFVSATLPEPAAFHTQLTYRFTSRNAGYGNRSGTMTAQVITDHTIRVTIADRNVDSAVIDEKWDEVGQYLIGSEQTLTYQPMQCEQTPWQTWEANSGRRYIRAPTEEEVLRHYYSAVYGIEVSNYTWVSNDGITCQACGVCPLLYHLEVTVNAGEMGAMIDEGWKR
jgi:hypothetical protein